MQTYIISLRLTLHLRLVEFLLMSSYLTLLFILICCCYLTDCTPKQSCHSERIQKQVGLVVYNSVLSFCRSFCISIFAQFLPRPALSLSHCLSVALSSVYQRERHCLAQKILYQKEIATARGTIGWSVGRCMDWTPELLLVPRWSV